MLDNLLDLEASDSALINVNQTAQPCLQSSSVNPK